MKAVKRRRLASLDAELAAAIASADEATQRAIALAATEAIAVHAGWPAHLKDAVNDVRENRRNEAVRDWLSAQADHIDDLRLRADQAGDGTSSASNLRIARAYSAARWAFDDDASAAAQDAVYHAAMGGIRDRLLSDLRVWLGLA
jgi:hypothetical protein